MGLIIPLFIPHRGCPHQCLFCNQESITGEKENQEDYAKTARTTIDEWLEREAGRKERREREVAFYGGSFSCLHLNVQKELLSLVQPYIEDGRVDGIRLSTRPDCVSPETGPFLRKFGVKKVELGVQSMDESVLVASKRGHSVEESVLAVELLKRAGLEVGMQVMVGLPLETRKSFLMGLEKIVEAAPHFVRLYPVLVVRCSELEERYLASKYQPLSMAEAIVLSGRFQERMDRANIPVIRIGLQASVDLDQVYVAGPFHPSFREIVQSRKWFVFLRKSLAKLNAGEILELTISHRDLSVVQGIKKYNITRLEHLGLRGRLRIVVENTRARGDARLQICS